MWCLFTLSCKHIGLLDQFSAFGIDDVSACNVLFLSLNHFLESLCYSSSVFFATECCLVHLSLYVDFSLFLVCSYVVRLSKCCILLLLLAVCLLLHFLEIPCEWVLSLRLIY